MRDRSKRTKLTNTQFIIIFLIPLTVLLRGCTQCSNSDSNHPNVIIILADDQGWGDLSLHGNPDISTPNIDAISLEGASFDRFYVQPVCSPTRAELLTGRYHVRTGVSSTSAGGERIDQDETLISEIFQASGYRTGCFGKWHSGSQHPYHPNSRGFQEYYGFTSGHWGHYFDPPLDHNGKDVQGKGYLPDDLTDRAIDFIGEGAEPFFVFMAYNTPHSPMQVPDRWWQKFEHKIIETAPHDSISQNHARAALAMVENLDWNVGRLTDYLRANDLEENTIVIYMTDNGPNGIRWNGGMKGRKGSTDEGGVRSPLFIKWHNRIAKGLLIPNISAAIDMAPTLIDLCAIKPKDKIEWDGQSLKPLLFQDSKTQEVRTIIHYWKGKVSVRNQDYKLDHEEALFNMIEDPNQLQDVQHQSPVVLQELINIKENWKSNVLQELPDSDNRPFPIGYSNKHHDYLPAGDGIPHGNIQRSNRYPNDSYFYNWISRGDSITWDTEILTSGTYEFALHYTCPPDQIGSTINLNIGDQQMSYQITETHDPPLVGANEDRVQRIESYIKEFKKVTIGKLKLEKGRQQLVLKASQVKNESVMDINRISVQRLTN